MDQSTIDQLNTLLGKSTTGGSSTGLFDINAIIQPLMPYIIALTVVSVILTVLYCISIIDKWRSNRAILDIRKTLHEMNERDRLRDAPHPAPAQTVGEVSSAT